MEIRARLFGGFNITKNNVPISGLNLRHQVLITYLCLRFPNPVPRADAAFNLWLDSTEDQAFTNLRKAIHHIKQVVEGDFIQTTARTLQININAFSHFDLLDFSTAIQNAQDARISNNTDSEQAALETAIGLYSGDLTPNLYDEWIIPERERFREQYLTGLDRLISLLETRQRYREAIPYAQRLLRMDSLREEGYRTLIRLHALNNDRAAALNTYHTCAGILSRELGTNPDAVTRELYERLLKNDTQTLKVHIPDRPITYPLVARENEWKILQSEWQKSLQGNLHVVLLSGEAGIGKTRLAEDLLRWASRQGIPTASAACYSAEGQLSFAPIISWLKSIPMEGLDSHWKNEIGRILPELQSNNPSPPITENWQKRVFFEAMARALLAQNEPLLLFLDDIQWCDEDTLEWLGFFLRFDKQAKILLLSTLRIEEFASNQPLQIFLADLRAENQLTDVELNRLNEMQTAELARHLLGVNFQDADAILLFRESEGVPLFIVEMANTGIGVDTVRKTDSDLPEKDPEASKIGMPPRLKAILERHLTRLSSPARAVIESAAVLGREFDFGLLKMVSEFDEGATVNALDELWRLRLMRERGGRYDFSHDKLRETTLSGISPIRLRWLHQRAGETLESQPGGAEYARIANHFVQADLPTKAAGAYALAASQANRIFAFADALEHLQNAARLEKDRATLANLKEERGNLLKMLDKREEAYEAYSQALGLSLDKLQRARLNRNQSTLKGRFETDTAREKYHAALDELNRAQNDSGYWHEWIDLQLSWIEICYWMQDAKTIDSLLEQVKQPVEQHGTVLQKIMYRYRLISSAFVNEKFYLNQSHVVLARETMLLAIELNNPFQVSNAKRQLGMVELFAGQLDAAETTFREAIALCEKNNDMNSMLIARAYLSYTYRRQRKLQDLIIETGFLENLLGQVSANPAYQGLVNANRAWLAWLEGDHKQARQLAQTALDIWQSQKNPYMSYWLSLMPLLAMAVDEGKTEEALSHAQALLAPFQMRLTPDIEAALHSTLQLDSTDPTLILPRLGKAVEMAIATGYL